LKDCRLELYRHQKFSKEIWLKLLRILRDAKDKRTFNKKEVRYVGHIFGSDGLKPNPDRVQAIIDMPVPLDRQRVHKDLWEWLPI
jgi:hypothetical protein